MRPALFSCPEELLAARDRRLLLLYSGGLDGSYFLHWAVAAGLHVTALHVALGAEDPARAAAHARRFGVPLETAGAEDEFIAEFVTAAIHGNTYYQGLYPVGSTLSRPLLARTAVRAARRLGCDTIVHTSTYMQNTAMRLGMSVLTLDPSLGVAAPYARVTPSRAEKAAALAPYRLEFPDSTYSVDATPWARVIENDTLENPELPLPDTGVFAWTRDPWDTPAGPLELRLGFEAGLPTRLNGEPAPLRELVAELNAIGGAHGVGRFSGLEQLVSGLKNHEIREAPAAHLITTAHRTLENAVLTDEESLFKRLADERASTLEVAGDWFGLLPTALRGLREAVSRAVSGEVTLRLHRGTVRVLAKSAPAGLYYHRFGADFTELMGDFGFAEQLTLRTLPERLRHTGTPGSSKPLAPPTPPTPLASPVPPQSPMSPESPVPPQSPESPARRN